MSLAPWQGIKGYGIQACGYPAGYGMPGYGIWDTGIRLRDTEIRDTGYQGYHWRRNQVSNILEIIPGESLQGPKRSKGVRGCAKRGLF